MSLDLSTNRLSRKAQRRILLVWLLALAVGLAGLNLLVEREYERDQHQWEVRLGLVAGAQSRAASDWVHDRIEALATLSGNVSLQLYLTELVFGTREGSDISVEPAELTYLRNLLIASADLGGFSAPVTDKQTIAANVEPTYAAGIAVTDATMSIIASTHSMPPLDTLPVTVRDPLGSNRPLTTLPFELTPGQPALAFRMPVYGVQQDASSEPLGFIVAVALLDKAFYDVLRSIPADDKTAESLLISPEGTQMRFFSPLKDGKKPFELTLDTNSPLASVVAARAPGTMITGADYDGQPSFALARQVEGMEWIVVRRVEAHAAMKETTARAIFLYSAYVLVAALITAGIVALWRHATALRAKQVAAHYKSLSHRIQKQEALLDLIAETTPIATYIVDESGKYRYANRRAAEEAEMERSTMPGKSVEAVLGGHRAHRLLEANATALAKNGEETLMAREEGTDGRLTQVHQSRHIPLAAIPLPANEEEHSVRGVLVIDQDITDVVRGEERRARTLQQLIGTLVEMVDRRDPHAAQHSGCVALLAREVAKQMQLDAVMVATAEIAGQLMNIGKITVPETLLTAKDALKDKDKARIRASIHTSADLLHSIEFDGPVVETLRQSQNKAPQLVTAQIIAAVNDFVAMISPRAWRSGMKMEDAMSDMLKHAGTRYERAVVVALVHYLENNGGRAALDAKLKVS